MTTGKGAWVAGTATLIALAFPAAAQRDPIGPCSPYRAADGDIPSEMPGCTRRLRPAPGSLADELEFRRARKGVDTDESAVPDEDAPATFHGRTRSTPKRSR